MPYRRLPNTDAARIRALQTAIVRKRNSSDYTVYNVNSAKTEMVLRTFENSQMHYAKAYDVQVEANKRHLKLFREARLYVSHFIQVLNMCVIRGEMKASIKEFYDLSIDSHTLPDINTPENLIEIGEKLIEGEQKRLISGGIPIYNPSIARVKVSFSLFKDAYIAQKVHQQNTTRYLSELSAQRATIDEVLKDIWNQVEESFASLPDKERLEKCKEYGIIYYYRKGEKIIK